MSLRLSIALPNHGILGGGTARGVQARGSNSAIVVVVVVVVAPRVAFTDCLASVPSSRNRFPPSECYTPWVLLPSPSSATTRFWRQVMAGSLGQKQAEFLRAVQMGW